ncbi:MAG: DUF5050 domain-containing protein, partial [Candidatus Poribacteria bacterium]|nr:DUF5050 domain-containing protein [Candidatus Poribacteria bacterium]
MKIRQFNRKSIALLFAMIVFFCSVQSLSFGQVTLTASASAPLIEATLSGSVVTLTLQEGTFEDNVRDFVILDNTLGVVKHHHNVRRLSNTEVEVTLDFNGDFDQDGTLTFIVTQWGIKNYNGSDLTAQIPVTATIESLTATAPAPLTKATLHNSTVTLTLRGRKFEDWAIFNLRVSGIPNASIDYARFLSGTEITVKLDFYGEFNRDETLTFWVEPGLIKNYHGTPLTAQIPVTVNVAPTPQPPVVTTPQPTTVGPLTATAPAPLTEATLHNSMVTLTLQGWKFENWAIFNLRVSGIPGIPPPVSIDYATFLSDTEITVKLDFDGDFDRDETLTFWVEPGLIKNYIGPPLTAQIPVTAIVEPPQAFKIRNPASTGLIIGYQIQWSNNDSWQNYSLNAGFIRTHQSDRNIPLGYPQIRFDYIVNDQQFTDRSYTLETAEYRENSDDVPTYHFVYNQQGDRLDLSRAAPQPQVAPTPQPQVGTTPQPNVVSTPQPSVVYIPDTNLRTAIQQEIGNAITTQTLLNLTTLDADASGLMDGSPVIRDLTGLEHATNLGGLYLSDNNISDISPLSGLTQMEELDLSDNNISDISPLVGMTQLTWLALGGNPLNAAAINTHIPAMQANGVFPEFDNSAPTTPQPNVVPTPQPSVGTTPQPTVVVIPDWNLRAEIQRAIGNTVTTQTLLNLTTLDASDLRIANLTGLEHATNLSHLYLWGNNISDVSPLAGLTQLTDLDLYDNNISDISPLVGLTRLTDLDLTDNPLNAAAINTHIPAIQARGTEVQFDNRTLTTPSDDDGMAIDNSQVDTRTPTVPIDPTQPAIYWGGDGIQRANLDGSNVQTLVPEVDVSDITLDVAGGKMYWINYKSVQRANFDGSQVETLVTGEYAPYLTVDRSIGKMYWLGYEARDGYSSPAKILRANLDGSNVETLVREEYVWYLTLDVAGGKMYWIGNAKILRANLDGSNVETLKTGNWHAWDLTLDVSGGKMYWMHSEVGVVTSKILRANLDGSNVETLVEDDHPSTLTLDVSSGKIYWIDSIGFRCANLDGSNVETLVRGIYVWNLTLDASAGKMYWIEDGMEDLEMSGGPGKIQRVNLDGSNIEDIVTDEAEENFALIPSQAPVMATSTPVVSKKSEVDTQTKTVHVRVDATDRPPMYWIDTEAGTLHRLVDAEVENLLPSVRNANSLTLDVVNAKLYWTEKISNTTGRVRRADLDGSNVASVREFNNVPLGIALDTSNGKLYVTNSRGKVQRLNLDGSNYEWNFIVNLDSPKGIAVDAAGRKVYWTEQTGENTGRVRCADLDGSNVASVREFNNVPLGIALDTSNGKLYVTNSRGKVQRLNLDGSNYEWNFIVNLDSPKGIAVDAAGRKVYWTEQTGENTGRVRCADLDGSNVASVREFNNVPLGIALDTSNGKLYVTNSRGKVQRLNLDGSNYEWNFIVNLDSPKGIAVDAAGQKLYLTSSDGKISRRNLSGGGSQVVVEGLVSPGNIVLNNSITAPEKSSTSETPAPKNKYDVNGDGTVNDTD